MSSGGCLKNRKEIRFIWVFYFLAILEKQDVMLWAGKKKQSRGKKNRKRFLLTTNDGHCDKLKPDQNFN